MEHVAQYSAREMGEFLVLNPSKTRKLINELFNKGKCVHMKHLE